MRRAVRIAACLLSAGLVVAVLACSPAGAGAGAGDGDGSGTTALIDSPLDPTEVGSSGGDFYYRGFYINAYPGSSLRAVDLWMCGDPGVFILTLTIRAGTYDGALLGASVDSVTFGGSATHGTSPNVTFEFDPALTVSTGAVVTCALSVLSAPGASSTIYYAVDTDEPNGLVIQTNGTSPPLDTFRRSEIAIRVHGQ